MEISMKYQWKSNGNSVEISMKHQWKSIEIKLKFNRNFNKIQMKSIGKQVEISIKKQQKSKEETVEIYVKY